MICHIHHKIFSSLSVYAHSRMENAGNFFFFLLKLKEAKSSLWIDCFTNRLADQPMLIV